MVTALIHLDAKQKKRLQRRAELRGESFSQEVRDAVDLYLDLPVNDEEELQALARAANQSAGRSVKKLDETIAYVDRILKSMRATRTDRCDLPRFGSPFRSYRSEIRLLERMATPSRRSLPDKSEK